jgi:hypothetical protein
MRELRLQRLDQVLGQYRDAVFPALAVAHQQLAALELDVLDAQAKRFEQPHARAIQQRGHQAGGARHFSQQRAHLGRRQQHHRQASRGLGRHHIVEPGQLHRQHLASWPPAPAARSGECA